jgi:hypothetical protein
MMPASPKAVALSRSASLSHLEADNGLLISQIPNVVRKWVNTCPSKELRTIDFRMEDSRSVSGSQRSTFGVRRGDNGRFSLARIDI